MDKQGNLLLLTEVAEELRRSVDGVRWLIKSQQLKGAKLGGRMVVRREDLDAFVNAAFADAVD
ncbi:helix-turn-helix domain-containing protein [Microbacterium binotii]|uniref:helix-turn-helix domain-containing protein n=1 Tax=Microbacterium binotii TaxID=462710 RepID=UPI001F45E674|nr:helix-turn-helix domain-containing protein [Microbacterium binotii]UIN30914.1 helix-turn-helix domain-containing protein [Microbacterium binotii]